MKKLLKIFGGSVALLIVLFAAAALFVHTLDADKYRPQLVDILSKKTGRAVRLGGPIGFSLGLGGVTVSIKDAAIANPPGASRQYMAGMGTFEIGVGLLPLLSHRLSINELSIENADILLETNAAGQHNWDFGAPAAASAPPNAPPNAAPAPTASGESLSIDKLTILNSQLAMRGADGKISSYHVDSLTLDMKALGAELTVKGNANGAPITLDVKTGIKDLLSRDAFPFDAEATYNALRLTAQGTADIKDSKADITAYEVTAGKTTIKGNASLAWAGVRPAIRGVMNSDRIDPADFKSNGADASGGAQPAAAVAAKPATAQHMFSDTPLPLSALKAVDADLNIAVGQFPMGLDALTNIAARLVLSGGTLSLLPIHALAGNAPVDVTVRLETAGSPAHLTFGMTAPAVDLGDLAKLGGMAPIMTGKAGANIQLAAAGDTPHALASSLGGVIVVTAEKGEIMTGVASGVSSALAAVLNPEGGGDAALNCLAARFIAKNGVLTDNGILIDSAPSTIAGKGSVNLVAETVSMTLRAKTKLVDVGGLVPAVEVSGDLSHPSYKVDTAAVVKNVIGSLVAGTYDLSSSGVPDLQTAPAGQNACVYTLDHPQNAASPTPVTSLGNANQKIQNIGKSLVKGLFGQ